MSTCTSTVGSVHALQSPVKYQVDSSLITLPTPNRPAPAWSGNFTTGTSVTLTYLHSFGVHQMVTRNANQATGGTPQTNSGGYLYRVLSRRRSSSRIS